MEHLAKAEGQQRNRAGSTEAAEELAKTKLRQEATPAAHGQDRDFDFRGLQSAGHGLSKLPRVQPAWEPRTRTQRTRAYYAQEEQANSDSHVPRGQWPRPEGGQGYTRV